MGLSADRSVQRREGLLVSAPVAAGKVIYAGALVCVNAAGYLVPADDDATMIFVGVAAENCDNSAGGVGALNCRVYTRGLHRLPFSGSITIANVGDTVYVKDDEDVALAATTTNDLPVGFIVGLDDDTSYVWVDIAPGLRIQTVTASERKFIRIQAAAATVAALGCAAPTVSGTPAEANTADGTRISLTTGASTTNSAGIISATFDLVRVAHNPTLKVRMATGASVADVRIWVALCSADLKASATPALSFVGFRFDAAADTNFMAMLSEGTNITAVDTGVAPAINTSYDLMVTRNSAGTYKFYIDGVLVATSSTYPPADATELGLQVVVVTEADAAKAISFEILDLQFGEAL